MKNTLYLMKSRIFFLGKRNAGLFILMGVFGMMGSVRAQSVGGKPEPTPELFQLGKTLYEKHCVVCHGIDGAGDGPASSRISRRPRDFTQNKFRLVSTTNMQATNEDLFKSITHGMPGSAMLPRKHLSEEQRWGLVYYVRYLAERKTYVNNSEIAQEVTPEAIPWDVLVKMLRKEIKPESLIQVPEEPVITSEGLVKGRELYVMACADCHGNEGKGDVVQKMLDSSGYPIRPRDLKAGIFMRNSSSEELYYRIIGGLPGTPMPSYQGVFTDKELWDLIHYVQTIPDIPSTSIEKGAQLYGMYCVSCHGENGEGGIKNSNAQTGEEVPLLKYVSEGFTAEEVKEKILTGVSVVEKLDPKRPFPPLTMPSWEDHISSKEIDDLIDFLFSLMPEEEQEEW